MVTFQRNQIKVFRSFTDYRDMLVGTRLLINFLQLLNETAFLNDVGTISLIFGPRWEMISPP